MIKYWLQFLKAVVSFFVDSESDENVSKFYAFQISDVDKKL